MLNRASILGDSEIEKTKVSLVCVSKRPWFLPVVAAMIEAQIHENIELVFVAHGDAFKGVDVEGILNRIRSVSVIRLGEDVLFGDALNEAVSRCSADLVTKIDDDDFYGPNYISRSIAAMMYNGFEEVAAVGKGRAFIYAGGINFFGVRFPKANENCLRKHVFGGTLFWSQIKTGFQKFRSVSSAVDTGFLEDIIAKGCQVYSSDRFDHILFRHRGEGHHTWRISDEDFVRPAQKIGSSLEVASACSSFDYAALEGLQRKILSASVKSYDGEPSDKSIKSLK